MIKPSEFIPISPYDLSGVAVSYTYTPEEESARRGLIDLIEAEKREYQRRVEPLIKRLAAIQGAPVFIVPVRTPQ